jgi:hypothetical protein
MGLRSFFRSAATGQFLSRHAAELRPAQSVQETSPAFPEYERQMIEQQYAQRIAKDIRENFPPQQALDIPAFIEARYGGVGRWSS